MPKVKQANVNETEATAMIEKRSHVIKVQRKVVETNMIPQPPRYTIQRPKKTNIGILSSRLEPNHPYGEWMSGTMTSEWQIHTHHHQPRD
jgi:hypothetical protein